MRRRIRSRLTFANVVSLTALFVALGGTATAVTYVVSSNSQVGPNTISGHQPPSGKHANVIPGSVNGQDVADNSLRGADINESTLGGVPSAKTLAGHPPSDFFLHCPGNLYRAADLCFEPNTRPAATYTAALKACASDQLRLPDEGELALAFDHLGAPQDGQWTASHWFSDSAGEEAPILSESSSRDLELGGTNVNAHFRCVTSATN